MCFFEAHFFKAGAKVDFHRVFFATPFKVFPKFFLAVNCAGKAKKE